MPKADDGSLRAASGSIGPARPVPADEGREDVMRP